ncbi:MAG: transcription antitermination factor NusB [Phycisphaerales bacterium]|nr:transcription antitermination factor NusB [Phycisphaerales bacterium]
MPKPNGSTEQSNNRTITDPRDAAYRHITRQAERMPDLGLFDLKTGSLDVRDASLAHAIVDGVITRWLTLSYIISALGGRPVHDQEPRMQAVLLGGAAQLLLMDRVPPHAVIDESVEWAKNMIRPKAGGMVNAILRRVSRAKGERIENWSHHLDAIPLSNGEGLLIEGLELPQSGLSRLSFACSISTQIIQRWEHQYTDPTEMAMHTLCSAPTLLYTGCAKSPIESDKLTPHESPNHSVYRGRRADLVELLHSRDDVWVQDAASSHVVDELEFNEDIKLIVDLCAGQGTKTRQLRARFPDAKIIAAEVDDTRLDTLWDVFGDDEQVRVMHAEDVSRDFGKTADLVLTDVPCSNTGVLARRREARYRPMKQQLSRIIPIQQSIVANADTILNDSGTLVYSTCSIEQDENESQASWIAGRYDMKLVKQRRIDPAGQPGDSPSMYNDGSFSAILKK